jgi:hypothetical protein
MSTENATNCQIFGNRLTATTAYRLGITETQLITATAQARGDTATAPISAMAHRYRPLEMRPTSANPPALWRSGKLQLIPKEATSVGDARLTSAFQMLKIKHPTGGWDRDGSLAQARKHRLT